MRSINYQQELKNDLKKFSEKAPNNEEFGIKGIRMFSWKCCRFFSKYTFSFILDISFPNELVPTSQPNIFKTWMIFCSNNMEMLALTGSKMLRF